MRFATVALLIVFSTGCTFWEEDKCLDRGGKWDHEREQCVFE